MQIRRESLSVELASVLGLPNDRQAVEALAATARRAGSGEGMSAWIRRAFALGITSIRSADLGAIDARLLFFPSSDYQIELNLRRPRTRQLFSLCHELAHLLLEREMPCLASNLKERSLFHSNYDLEEERLADQIAAHMLMPEAAIQSLARSYHSPLTAIVLACKQFSVSLAAASIRYREVVGTCPTIISFGIEDAGERIRYREGPLWSLPFAAAVPNSWSLSLGQLGARFQVGETQEVTVPVSTADSSIERYGAHLRVVSNSLVLLAF